MADTTLLGKMAQHYGCGPVDFAGDERSWYEQHLVFDHAVAPEDASPRQQYEAVADSVRDLLTQRWLKTQHTHDRQNPKQVYYLADLTPYVQTQERVGKLYGDRGAWSHKAILNAAYSGKFSSDRSIRECAEDIWKDNPCPVK